MESNISSLLATPSMEHDDSTLNDIRPDQLEVIAIAKAQATVSHVLGPYTGISYAMHPCIRFSAAPEMEYDKALKWLDRYLIETRDKRLMFDPKEQSFDASFGDEWDRAGALVDADAASSRTGFVISFTNCPVIWTTRLSTQIALSSAETGHIALITALRGISVHDIDTSSQCNDVFANRSMTQCSNGIAYPLWVGNDSARGSEMKSHHASDVSRAFICYDASPLLTFIYIFPHSMFLMLQPRPQSRTTITPTST
jgi:hypothetical protein